ncbi:MAG TPA: glycosyltransferase family 9 protein [Ferruginibacter sp.]|nr:glycosyltransferase family 9 protein [Ferruginibacter sp.]
MQKILVIQTAFIGDVVLSTALAEKLYKYYPGADIDYLVRKGNESLLENNPAIKEVLIWDKKQHKKKNLFAVLKKIRAKKYDAVINVQRYFSTGFLTAFSGATQKIGFDKNPLSFLFSKKVSHIFDTVHPRHEVERNNDLIRDFTDDAFIKPVLYPSEKDNALIKQYENGPFVTMTPSSVWFTKKYPVEKWVELINNFNPGLKIYLLGGIDNINECGMICTMAANKNVEVLAGKLSFLQSAALMKKANMNYVNDSAPLHFTSAVNAPVTAIFCSTVPAFGYTPLSDISFIVETPEPLACRPCGLHGWKACPQKHFRCAYGISIHQVLNPVAHAI